MPGLLKRPHDRIDGGADGDSSAGAPEKKRQALDSTGAATQQSSMNGGTTAGAAGAHPENGVTGNGGYSPDAGLIKAVEAATGEAPPELFHVTGSYISLSTLVERLAQETFVELEQLVNDLAEMQSQQVNGYGSGQSVELNIRKKEKLWHFAQGYRAKFIKLLVLSQWSRQSEAVSKVIDINVWMNQQKEQYRNCYAWLGELKRMLSHRKLPAPDLKTTLEILSTGKADWYPDIGFDSQEPYTPKQLLKALRTINTHLTIRLNVHEDIPREMMDFSISSGRATFKVQDEFELDLSIADEDPSSQLYFIDFRFAFSPCMTEVPDGPLRAHIEARTNDILRVKGLAGCYEFLHEFVVTHKLTILRHQAYELSRGRWTENIKVEPVHRSLVIQYWTNRPGPKSWIEIGTRRIRKEALGSSRNVSHLAVRWHRGGKEVVDHGIEINVADLSLEAVLKEVIAAHTNYIFRHIKRGLKQSKVYAEGELSVKHRAHPKEPAECLLKMQLTDSLTAAIIQEPVSGSFAISPSSSLHFRAERDLNRLRDPANEATAKLSLLRCNETLEQVHLRAKIRRWQPVQTINLNRETIKDKFKRDDVLRLTYYRIPHWGKEWVLALTCGLSGDRWFAVQRRAPPQSSNPTEIAATASQPVRRALLLKLKGQLSSVFEASYASLSQIERTAAAVISQYVNAVELTRTNLYYTLEAPSKPLPKVKAADIFVHLTKGIASNLKQPWCRDIIKLRYMGLQRSQATTTTVVTARLWHQIPNVAQLASTMDAAIAFHPHNGDFTFRVRSALGVPCISEIKRRFARIATLVQFITSVARQDLVCSHISIDSLKIVYETPPAEANAPAALPLTATIHFPEKQPMRLSLEAGNPHIRIIDHLNSVLNSPSYHEPLRCVLTILRKTLPLLRGIDKLERTPRAPGVDLRVVARSATSYRVALAGDKASTRISFEVKMRERAEDGSVWFMELLPHGEKGDSEAKVAAAAAAAARARGGSISLVGGVNNSNNKAGQGAGKADGKDSDEVVKARTKLLREAWSGLAGERGGRFYGLGGGILSYIDGAEQCMDRVYEVLTGAVINADKLGDGAKEGKKETEKGTVGADKGGKGGNASAAGAQKKDVITLD